MWQIFKRWSLELEDWLRYQPRVRRALSRYRLWRHRSPEVGDPQAAARAVANLCAAARLTDDTEAERSIQTRIARTIQDLDATRIEWKEFAPEFGERRISKAAILKPYLGPMEKGVVFISFEREWVNLLSVKNLSGFADRYVLVIAPSSSAHNVINYLFPLAYPGTIFTILSHDSDRARLPGVSHRFVIVPLFASSWVNPELFQPVPKMERAYDLIMVASWGKVKRHQALFAALRSMPKELRILLVGQDQEGRSADTIREMARWYGVADRFTILSNQPYREIPRLFCQARASVILSKREGACVTVAESMFADVPVAILRGAEIGSRVFINDQTGRFLDDATLARDLMDLIRNADRYQPRAWAEANISCYRSSQILNEAIKTHSLSTGQAWTQDIAPLQWAPDPQQARPEDRVRLGDERKEILARFGLEIGPAPLQ
jgi:hypothetical protein